MSVNERFDHLLDNAMKVYPSDEALLRMQEALAEELKQPQQASTHEVMTVEELVDFLRVEPTVLEDYLGEIPCFELGGNLLFRRSAVENWIRKKEQQFKYDITDFKAKRGSENFFIA